MSLPQSLGWVFQPLQTWRWSQGPQPHQTAPCSQSPELGRALPLHSESWVRPGSWLQRLQHLRQPAVAVAAGSNLCEMVTSVTVAVVSSLPAIWSSVLDSIIFMIDWPNTWVFFIRIARKYRQIQHVRSKRHVINKLYLDVGIIWIWNSWHFEAEMLLNIQQKLSFHL